MPSESRKNTASMPWECRGSEEWLWFIFWTYSIPFILPFEFLWTFIKNNWLICYFKKFRFLLQVKASDNCVLQFSNVLLIAKLPFSAAWTIPCNFEFLPLCTFKLALVSSICLSLILPSCSDSASSVVKRSRTSMLCRFCRSSSLMRYWFQSIFACRSRTTTFRSRISLPSLWTSSWRPTIRMEQANKKCLVMCQYRNFGTNTLKNSEF